MYYIHLNEYLSIKYFPVNLTPPTLRGSGEWGGEFRLFACSEESLPSRQQVCIGLPVSPAHFAC